MLCGENEALLFAGIDAGSGSAEIAAAALANLSEHQGFSVAKNQVNFSKAATIVGLNQFQAVPLQVLCSDQLGPGAGFC